MSFIFGATLTVSATAALVSVVEVLTRRCIDHS